MDLEKLVKDLEGRALYYLGKFEDRKSLFFGLVIKSFDVNNIIANTIIKSITEYNEFEEYDKKLYDYIIKRKRYMILEEYELNVPFWEEEIPDKLTKDEIRSRIKGMSFKDHRTYEVVAKLYLERKQIKKAISYLKRGLEIKEDENLHTSLAKIYLKQSLRNKENEHLWKAYKINNKNINTLFYLIYSEINIKKYDSAEKLSREMLKLDKNLAYYFLGKIYFEKGKETIEIAYKYLSSFDEKSDFSGIDNKIISDIILKAKIMKSILDAHLGKEEEFIKNIDEIFSKNYDNSIRTYENIYYGIIMNKLPREKIFKNISKLSAESLHNMINIRSFYSESIGDMSIELEELLKKDPDNPKTKLNLVLMYENYGYFDRAMDVLNEIDISKLNDFMMSSYLLKKGEIEERMMLKEIRESYKTFPLSYLYEKGFMRKAHMHCLRMALKSLHYYRSKQAIKIALNRAVFVGKFNFIKKRLLKKSDYKIPRIREIALRYKESDPVDVIDIISEPFSYNMNNMNFSYTNIINYFIEVLKMPEKASFFARELIDVQHDKFTLNALQKYFYHVGNYKGSLEFGVASMFAQDFRRRHYRYKPFPKDYILRALDEMGSLDEAIDELSKAFLNQNSQFRYIGTILEKLLEHKDGDQKLEETSKKVIELIFRDNSTPIEMSINKFSHPVAIHKRSEFFNQIIKLNDPMKDYEEEKKKLYDEYRKTRFVRNSLKPYIKERKMKPSEAIESKPFMFVPLALEPTEIIIMNKKRYGLFMQYMRLPMLLRRYDGSHEVLKDAMRKTSLIHVSMMRNINNAPSLEVITNEDYISEFMTRVVYGRKTDKNSSFGENPALWEFIDKYRKYISLLEDNNFPIHNDLSWLNVLAGSRSPLKGDLSVYFIDFEKMAIGNPSKDDSKFLMYAPITKEEIMEYRDYKMNHMIDLLVGLGWDSSRTSEFAEKYRHNFNINMVHNALTEAGTWLRRNEIMKSYELLKKAIEFSKNTLIEKELVLYLKNSRAPGILNFLSTL